jgi:2'-hydroxyisoflavone reductase
MKVLVLGGTRFLGRHIVERLALREHEIVCFHRGQTRAPLPAGVEERYGDRNAGLDAVVGEHWDAVVDTCCYRPEQMRAALELQTDRYLLISTANVYADLSLRGVVEVAPTIETFDPNDEAAAYGGNKAACERLLMGSRIGKPLAFRAGLIAGAWDPTGRFTYWCRRFLQGGRVLAPGDPRRPIQYIDAADLAAFAEFALAGDLIGAFNVVGPATRTSMAEFLDACVTVAGERGAPSATMVWADDEFLLQRGVQEWTELPMWLTDPNFAGIVQLDNSRAIAAGLRPRPIAESVRAVLDWLAVDDSAARSGMSPEREAELLQQFIAAG